MENESFPERGKLWCPYINNAKAEWQFVCENNRMIKSTDEIIWKFENAGTAPDSEELNQSEHLGEGEIK